MSRAKMAAANRAMTLYSKRVISLGKPHGPGLRRATDEAATSRSGNANGRIHWLTPGNADSFQIRSDNSTT